MENGIYSRMDRIDSHIDRIDYLFERLQFEIRRIVVPHELIDEGFSET